MSHAIVIALILIGIFIGVGAFALFQKRRRTRLINIFGPEYDRVVQEIGDRRRAETTLLRREERVDKLSIHPLTPADCLHFQEVWNGIQIEFVDDPRRSLSKADSLLLQVMTACGYPTDGFEQQAADISVNHPLVVQSFRDGHQIVAQALKGEATTEEIRQAMLNYRALFDELVGTREIAGYRVAS